MVVVVVFDFACVCVCVCVCVSVGVFMCGCEQVSVLANFVSGQNFKHLSFQHGFMYLHEFHIVRSGESKDDPEKVWARFCHRSRRR